MDHLTVIDPALDSARSRTVPGMAHWAGSGPKGKTCRQCLFWDNCGADPGYYAKTGKHHGSIKPRSCRKYQQMMNNIEGPAVPHTAAACKYFSPNDVSPQIMGKW